MKELVLLANENYESLEEENKQLKKAIRLNQIQ